MKLSFWRRNRSTIAILLFSAGFLVSLGLATVAIWAGIEAAMFNPSRAPEGRLRLQCPIIMTSAETATVSVTFTNPTDRELRFPIYANISDGYVTLMRQVTTRLVLEPQEKRQLSWEITADDAAYGRFVLVRIHALRSAPLPYRQGSCGVFVVNVPFISGRWVTALLLAAGLLTLGGGMAGWLKWQQPLDKRARGSAVLMTLLSALVLAALIVAFLNWWIVGILIIAFAILLMGALLERSLN